MHVPTESIRTRLRTLLSEYSDGLTVAVLSELTNSHRASVIQSLYRMPDCYIDRWQKSKGNHKYASVWCIANIPKHCPHPTDESYVK